MKESHKFVSRFSDFLLDDRKKISDILSGHLFSRTFEGSRFFRPQKGNSQLFFTHFGKQTLFETTIFFFLTFEVAEANDDAVASGKNTCVIYSCTRRVTTCCVCFLLFCFACYLQNQFQYILCWHTYI